MSGTSTTWSPSLTDTAPGRVVVAADEGPTNPLIGSFVRIATAASRD
ncbi:hypothetical protein [Streptomyces sp. YGL11-2]